MKVKSKGLIVVAVAVLVMAVLVPVYALGDQSGIMQHDRDQDCEPQGPATRAYGEDTPVQAQEEKPEDPLLDDDALEEDTETPIREQTENMEQLRDCDCENEDCEQNQYQSEYQYQYRCGQEED